MDESVLKTTRYTKQSLNHSIKYSVTYTSPRPTPHSTSLLLDTLHIPPRLNSLLFTALTDLRPTSKFLHFPSLHSLRLSLSNLCSWKYSISSVLQNPFTSLHFTSLNTFLLFCPYMLDFLELQIPFTSLHLSYLSPFCFCNSVTCFRFHFNNE